MSNARRTNKRSAARAPTCLPTDTQALNIAEFRASPRVYLKTLVSDFVTAFLPALIAAVLLIVIAAGFLAAR